MPEPAGERATVWRIHAVMGGSNSSGGNRTYYEDYDRFERALYDLALEAEANSEHRRDLARWMRVRGWWKRDHDEDEPRWFCKRIVGVDQLVSDEWVPLEWHIEPPRLVLNGGLGPDD
jgi:hypothetical protein